MLLATAAPLPGATCQIPPGVRVTDVFCTVFAEVLAFPTLAFVGTGYSAAVQREAPAGEAGASRWASSTPKGLF